MSRDKKIHGKETGSIRSYKTLFTLMKSQLRQNRKSLLVTAGLLFFLCHLSYFFYQFIQSIYYMNYTYVPLLPALVWIFLSIILYLLATRYEFYSFHQVRLILTAAVLFHAWLLCTAYIFGLLSQMFLPAVMNLKTDMIFTESMVLILGRVLTELPLLPIGYLLYKGLFYILKNKDSRTQVLGFKLTHILKPDSGEIVYDIRIVKDIRTGKYIPIYQQDRYLHILVDGTSGTGKTSSTILPAIKDDLNMRCKAENKQIEQLKIMEQNGKITYIPNGRCFTVNNFTPVPDDTLTGNDKKEHLRLIQQELDDIRLQYPVCGITALAPDDSLTDDICRLCDARGIPYNRIDATRDKDGLRKKNWIGMNPFYIPNDMDEEEKNQLIVKKAVIFSDVMQCITDLKGKADSYFTNLNRQMIANIAILVMVTVPVMKKRYASPADLQLLINNFDLMGEYVDKLEEIDKHSNRYTFIVAYVRQDLLGTGRTKMEDQSRGTRNIINEFLLMPASKEVFCTQDSIDFDRVLRNGEITVCNYNLAAGDTDAVAFGLFFLLSFNNSVLSRPGTEKTRTPHFFYIDELPVLIHPSLEKNFVLFRKYRVAMFVAIQTVDQLEKNEVTKYMKGVILGCAHAIVFGRSSLSDMEIFSALAGVHDDIEEQQMTSETSLSSDDPHLSYSSREAVTKKNVLEEIDIRLKDFQEVTFFTTRNGRPLPVIQGKVSFLKEQDWEDQKRTVPSMSYDITERTEDTAEPCAAAEPSPSMDELYFNSDTHSGYLIHSSSKDVHASPATPTSAPEPVSDPEDIGKDIPEGSESLDDLI